mgnify:FL=1
MQGPQKPVFVERVKTIIVEANETNSKSYDVGSYETILNKSIEINNGDTISLESAFVDTSNINVENIFIPEDVDIRWENGSYAINQDLLNFAPATNKGVGALITDNQPLVFSQFHTGANSQMVLWTTVVSTKFNTSGAWGGVPISFQVMGHNGKFHNVLVDVPDFPGSTGKAFHNWDLNIIGRIDHVPLAIDPHSESPVGPQLYSFDAINRQDKGSRTGNIYTPINLATAGPGSGKPEAEYVELDQGYFTPAINRGSFTLPSGQYTPTHLAKILTDGFDSYNVDRLGVGAVPRNEYFLARVQGNVNDTVDNSTLITVPAVFFQSFIERKWVRNQLVGWNANITYFSANPDPSTSPPTAAVIHNVSKLVVKSLDTDAANTFRVQILNPVAVDITFGDSGYPATGGPTAVLSPPEGVYDGGSAFLQHTSNYQLTGVDGKPMFAFVDAVNNSNVFSYYTGPAASKYIWTGSNNVEVIWDDEHKRFKFNYLHFPLTSGADTGPAIINQVGYAFYEDPGDDTVVPPVPAVAANYYRNYSYGSRNITTRAYGGCFFTHLEPFNSFWQRVMGFQDSVLAKVTASSVLHDFTGGFAYPTPSMAPIEEGFAPTIYEEVRLPLVTLKVGENITQQLFVLGDLTGKPLDYTGALSIPFSPIATPLVTDGRVAVSEDDVTPITAGQGEAIGVTTSGFYIADIDIGTSYNESIGSDKVQLAYTRNIRAIINRYYSANSYTSSEGNGISYIHYGNSFQLSSIKVRLTNSDGTAILDLGTDNSIFIKVVKQEQINVMPDPMPPPPAN